MDKYYRNESVIRGDLSNKEFLIQINKRLDQSESRMSKNSVTSLSTKSVTHRNRKNMDCVLFVEDVSLGHTTLAERYIKYIAQHSQILRHKVLTNV